MRAIVLAAAVFLLVGCGGGSDSNGSTPQPGDLYVSSVAPDHGTLLGGTRITLRGGGFSTGVTAVWIDGVAATDVSVASDTSLSCTTPAGEDPGPVPVTVETGSDSATEEGLFRYNSPPIVLAVVPPAGFAYGALTVSILGYGFSRDEAGTPTVTFGDTLSPLPQVVSDTLIFATTPPLPPGIVDVTVSNANGEDTLPNGFLYLGAASTEVEATSWSWPFLSDGRALWLPHEEALTSEED